MQAALPTGSRAVYHHARSPTLSRADEEQGADVLVSLTWIVQPKAHQEGARQMNYLSLSADSVLSKPFCCRPKDLERRAQVGSGKAAFPRRRRGQAQGAAGSLEQEHTDTVPASRGRVWADSKPHTVRGRCAPRSASPVPAEPFRHSRGL